MSSAEEKKDEASTTEPKRPTPSDAQAGGEATMEFDLADATLAALRQRYELLAELGRGGMGVVYKARDRETGDVVAVKVLLPEIAARSDILERFKSELLLARKITHKNICRVHDLNRFGPIAAISMEYIEGESLRVLLDRVEALSVRQARKILQQVLAGLAEAHAQGVVHRDLKPENILIARDGTVKVMDFGIARSAESNQTGTGLLIGTPRYMSPEQAEGKPVDARSDIYSLGLVLYEMFTGRHPFQSDTAMGYATQHVHETPPPPRSVEPDLPDRIGRAIEKCLEKNSKKRFQSVAELEEALLARAPVSPGAEEAEAPLPVHLTRWQRSDWALVAAAIAGLALFFPFFERTSLAPRSQVHFDRSVLLRIAQDYAQRVGAPLSQDYRIGADPAPPRYDYLATKAGAPAALELANNPVPYWEWYVEWRYADRRPTQVWVNNRGSLTTFTRDFPAGSGTERLSPEEAKPTAEKALADFFDRKASELRLESAAGDTWQGHPATSFLWVEPKDYYGLQPRYTVRFVGREIAALDVSYDPPAGFIWQVATGQVLPWLALLLVWLVLGLYQRLHVDLAARWRTVTVALAFVIGDWLGWRAASGKDPFATITTSTTLGLGIALFMFFASIAFEWSLRRAAPSKFSNFIRLFDRRAFSKPCGLAILRGTFLGLALLGVDCFLVWMGTSHFGMRLDSLSQVIFQVYPYLRSSGASAHITLDTIGHTLGFGFTIGFFASFLARFLRPTWVAAFVAAALAAATVPGPLVSLGAVQPYHGKVLLLLIDCLLLVWVFTRFDVLTLLAAVFTFAFWWQNYRLLVMFEPAGNLEQWLAFAVWGLFVLAAAAIASQSSLRSLRQRLAAAFE